MGITLSIIVPVYNVENYLDESIKSLLEQTFKDFELILIDDGSPDNCGNICEEYAQKDNRIKVIHQENRGLSAARNCGIERAAGKYITFIDSDDMIRQDTFSENMSVLLADESIELLEYPIFVHYESAEQYIWKENNRHVYDSDKIFIDWIENGGYNHGYACNKIYKRELFDRIRFPIGKSFEDVHTLPDILKNVKHLYISDKGLYFYFKRNTSITTLYSYNKIRDLLDANLTIWKTLENYHISKDGLLIYYLIISNIVIDLFKYKKEDIGYKEYVIKELSLVTFSLNDLWKANISKRVKYKNISLITMGLRTHCKIYNLLHKLTRHS